MEFLYEELSTLCGSWDVEICEIEVVVLWVGIGDIEEVVEYC